MPAKDIEFAIQIAPTGTKPDHELYPEVIDDCRLAQSLGYTGAWMLEHHFSDYHPTPSPLLFLAHVAAACPTLDLGTSVLVLPWYHPLRLAGEISMLNALTKGTLHLGMGRGTAKLEYDSFGVDMSEARSRYAEIYQIVVKAMRGEPFTFEGKHYQINRPVRLRPTPSGKKVHFYGAIGSPGSAEIMADLGLPPLASAFNTDDMLTSILPTWRARAAKAGFASSSPCPITIRLMMADTDEEAFALGRKYFPYYFQVQADHYEVDSMPWVGVPGYEQFNKLWQSMRAMSNPDNVHLVFDSQLVGSPERVRRRLRSLVDMGFDYVVVAPCITGVPMDVRQDQIVRFARDVAPEFSSRFRAAPRRVAAGD